MTPSNINPFDLTGKTALVTGCTRGIGQACAVELAKAGANIMGVSRSGEDQHTSNLVIEQGKSYTSYQCDFADRESLQTLIQELKQEKASVDILVNNAGTILRKPAAEHPDEFWDEVMDVNLRSQFILSREIGKTMLERGTGKIIFIASLLSFQGGITVPGYAASKGGIRTLTMALANEWAGKGVNVNAIAPGYIATDNTRALREDEDRNRTILERIPAGRWGNPEDIAGSVVFLASPAANYIHGTTLLVDGGWMGR